MNFTKPFEEKTHAYTDGSWIDGNKCKNMREYAHMHQVTKQ
jgi:hypothetical protein